MHFFLDMAQCWFVTGTEAFARLTGTLEFRLASQQPRGLRFSQPCYLKPHSREPGAVHTDCFTAWQISSTSLGEKQRWH